MTPSVQPSSAAPLVSMRTRWPRLVAIPAAIGLVLAAVLQMHAAGQPLLATLLLLLGGLAVWVYTQPRAHALRYVFPGVAAALIFVVFPMLVTVLLGFTNYSSRNLFTEDEVRQALLAETEPVAGSQHAFELLGTDAAARLRLTAPDGRRWVTPAVPLAARGAEPLGLQAEGPETIGAAARPLRDVVSHLETLRSWPLQAPDGTRLALSGLREYAQLRPLYRAATGSATGAPPSGALIDAATGSLWVPDATTGFFTRDDGATLQPGYRVSVGLQHYRTVLTEPRFREPFLSVLAWTIAFSALTVAGATALGLLLAVLFNWEALQLKGVYRLILFLPYAVPGFISILVFKGLFNQNLGEINLILNALFGIQPAWFSDPLLARTMLLIVNIWLGFPYMMVLCSGLIKSIPADLTEASAILGAGPWVHFRRVTLPLILTPLTPLLIGAFAFNFNNFVLISLLTGGRPDHLDSTVPAGTTDILVSYTWRIAFQDSGQQFGLAAAVSTIIFLMVAALTLLQLRLTRQADASSGRGAPH